MVAKEEKIRTSPWKRSLMLLAKAVNAQIILHDLSIAHRLQARQEGSERSVILRFDRRIRKVKILEKKNN